MSLHSDAVALLAAWTAPDAAQEQQRAAYLAYLRQHADGVYRGCTPDHLTASVVVLDADAEHTLLTLHAKAGRWFQLGGHCEQGDVTLAGAALRETVEESGIAEVRLDAVPIQLSPHPVPFCRPSRLRDGEVTRHLDVRFVAVAPPGAEPRISEESRDLRWWPLEDLPDPEPDLVQAVRLARARVQAQALASSSSPGGGWRSAASDQPSR